MDEDLISLPIPHVEQLRKMISPTGKFLSLSFKLRTQMLLENLFLKFWSSFCFILYRVAYLENLFPIKISFISMFLKRILYNIFCKSAYCTAFFTFHMESMEERRIELVE